MKSQDRNPKLRLDQTLQEIRNESIPAPEAHDAAARVWTTLGQTSKDSGAPVGVSAEPAPVETLRHCADFQALIPAYRSRTLAAAQALLLKDHTHGCVPCRKALQLAGAPAPAILPGPNDSAQPAAGAYRRMLAWGMAAALLIVIGWTQRDVLKIWLQPVPEVYALAESMDGTLLKVAGQDIRPLALGERIGPKERIRTARGAWATLQLADGSRIEMRERSELVLLAGRGGATIQLDRGSVIVSAARQRSGRLNLTTPDFQVSVTGTIFSAERGAKGSRVRVLEGEVEVAHGRSRQVLTAGRHFASHPSFGASSAEEEIAWSRNADRHRALVRSLSTLSKNLAERLSSADLRFDSRLLPLVPEGTLVYGAFPNIGATLGEAFDEFRRQMNDSSALREWWEEMDPDHERKPDLEEIFARIRAFGGFLEDEIILALMAGRRNQNPEPLLMAEVNRPSEFRAWLDGEVARLNAAGGGEPGLRIIDLPAALSTRAEGPRRPSQVLFLVQDRLVAASTSLQVLQKVAINWQDPAANPFAATDFYTRIRAAYREGVSWLFTADLATLLANDAAVAEKDREFYQRLGIADLHQLIVERKTVAGKTENRAAINFKQTRQGMAAWLAEPGPMGALEFVSPEALGVAAFTMKAPGSMVDELFGLWQSTDPEAWQRLLEFQAENGLDVRADMAAPLGGEFLLAMDGPILPVPSWKLVVEVYDPARLQKTLEWGVAEINRQAALAGQPGLTLTQELSGSQVFYKLAPAKPGLEAHYTFWEGFLVVAPSRVLLTQALQYRKTGYTLSQSSAFRSLLPVDGQAHVSALLYENSGALARALSKQIPDSLSQKSLGSSPTLQQAGAMEPSVIAVYGEKDRIVLANRGDLALSWANLAGLQSLRRMVPN